MRSVHFTKRSTNVGMTALLLIALPFLVHAHASAGGKWNVAGTFVEGCSCMGVCPCEQTGAKDGCDGVAAMMFTSGTYEGTDLSGTKIAYATNVGQWVRLYVDAKDSKRNKAAKDFASAYYSAFGKIEEVKDAKIDISGSNGKYSVSVDNGTIMKFQTEPVLGGDQKTPIKHTNTYSKLNPTILQGKTVSASFKDGERSFTLEGSNSYFNSTMKSSGAF